MDSGINDLDQRKCIVVIKTTMVAEGRRWIFFQAYLKDVVSNNPMTIKFPHRKQATGGHFVESLSSKRIEGL